MCASAAVVTSLACCDAGWQADPEHAWFPEHRSPESITTATDSNRMISVSRLEAPKPCHARRSVVPAEQDLSEAPKLARRLSRLRTLETL